METVSVEELEGILERVESAETTGADADKLRHVLRDAGVGVLSIELKRLSITAAKQRDDWRDFIEATS